MMRFLVVLLVIICVVSSKKRPNIILIVSDDLGYDDIEKTSLTSRIKTPNIDNLISSGQYLSYHYGQCVCSASRSTILTGKYSKGSVILSKFGKTFWSFWN